MMARPNPIFEATKLGYFTLQALLVILQPNMVLVFHNHSKIFFGLSVQISILASLNNLLLHLSTPQALTFHMLTAAPSQMVN
jgi:hypothetical protein